MYIGTDLGVYYRKESEINWELYQENLPNVIVTDLEVHEATNKLYATTFGRGIWVIDLAVEAEGGAPDELFEAGIHLTPNPASSTATLTIKQFEGNQLQVSLIDITGKQLMTEQITLNNGNFQKSYNLSQFHTGLYFLKLSQGKTTRVKRLLITR